MVVVLAVYATAVFLFVRRSASSALDQQLRGDFQLAAAMVDRAPDGRITTWFDADAGGGDEESPWLQVWSPAGELLYRNSVAEGMPIPAAQRLAAQPEDRLVSLPTPAAPYRVLTRHGKVRGQPVVVQVARSEAPMEQEIQHVVLILMLGLPVGVALAGLGGYTLARRALAPIERMTDLAKSITAEHLSDRLPVQRPADEMGRLATVFNETLGRLEGSFQQMRRFTADVSHELRTPLTAIRSVGEVGLREHRDDAAYRAIISSMLEEVDRLSGLVDRLLVLSRAESGQARLSVEAVDLRELAEDVVGYLGVLAEEKRQTLVVDCVGAPKGLGDRLVLRQSVINLVHNAIKYTPAGGRIEVRVSEVGSNPSITVIDNGPGIAADVESRLFDRYARGGDSHSGDVGGSGLGLAIAKWAVEASGGALTLERSGGNGSVFRITLPRPARPDPLTPSAAVRV
jgi:heavy metal sensor kinase